MDLLVILNLYPSKAAAQLVSVCLVQLVLTYFLVGINFVNRILLRIFSLFNKLKLNTDNDKGNVIPHSNNDCDDKDCNEGYFKPSDNKLPAFPRPYNQDPRYIYRLIDKFPNNIPNNLIIVVDYEPIDLRVSLINY